VWNNSETGNSPHRVSPEFATIPGMLTPQQKELLRTRIDEVVRSGMNDTTTALDVAELLIEFSVRNLEFFLGMPGEDRARTLCKKLVDKAADEIA
jgi:hypothetical protein